MHIIFIAVGGAAGALLRYWISNGTHLLLGRGFPYGTLAVNMIGSVLIGFLYIYLYERLDTSPELRAGLMIGLLGAFTTFSTFSLETLNMFEAGEHIKATINIISSVTLCIVGCWFGILLGRQL